MKKGVNDVFSLYKQLSHLADMGLVHKWHMLLYATAH